MLIHFFQFLFCRLCLGYRTRLESLLSVHYSMCCQNPVWSQLTRGRAETSISPEVCDKDILCKLQLDQNRAGNMLSSERLKGSSPFKTWEWGCFCFWTYFSELWITARFNQHWFASCRFVRWLRKNSVIAAWWFSFFWIVVSQKFDGGKNMSACCSKVSRETIAHQNEQI